MKTQITIFLFLIFSFDVGAQFHYNITSNPDSAEVLVNGETHCYTPCNVSYYWRDKVDDKMIFAVKAPGYEIWADTLFEKPYELTAENRVVLERQLPDLMLDSTDVVVGFDKLLADFKDGRSIGSFKKADGTVETLKWEGNTKIGESSFESSFYEIIADIGFQTPFSKKITLFDKGTDRVQLPRYVVGIVLKDFDVQIEHDDQNDYGAGKTRGSAKMQFEWQVLDKRSGEVALTYENEGRSNFRTRWQNDTKENLVAFENALIDFLENSGFHEMVRDSESIYESTRVSGDDSLKTNYVLSRPSIPQFASLSEMIRHADAACVTVVTDGGHGSGVVIDPEGYVLSAYHVVDGVNKIKVKFSQGLQLDARIVAYDVAHDIVLLDITGSGFQALPLNLTTEVDLGAEVITIGTPADLELGQSISRGILSGKRLVDDRIYFQMDMSISPGNSGGPLLNSAGEVIGIIQRKLIGTGIEGISFALPTATAAEMLGIELKD